MRDQRRKLLRVAPVQVLERLERVLCRRLRTCGWPSKVDGLEVGVVEFAEGGGEPHEEGELPERHRPRRVHQRRRSQQRRSGERGEKRKLHEGARHIGGEEEGGEVRSPREARGGVAPRVHAVDGGGRSLTLLLQRRSSAHTCVEERRRKSRKSRKPCRRTSIA